MRSLLLCALLLTGCASPGPEMVPWVASNPVDPGPMPDRWYVTGVTTEPRELRVMCHGDCLPITVSERNRPGLGVIVFYDIGKVPALLQTLQVKSVDELVGKQFTRDDERNPVLASIVSQGRECSENLRRHPQNMDWC